MIYEGGNTVPHVKGESNVLEDHIYYKPLLMWLSDNGY